MRAPPPDSLVLNESFYTYLPSEFEQMQQAGYDNVLPNKVEGVNTQKLLLTVSKTVSREVGECKRV
jgi:hypothetical protein